MKRREFLATGMVAGAIALQHGVAEAQENATQHYLEIRQYTVLISSVRKRLFDYLENAAIPAWNKLGITLVGVMTPRWGPNQLTTFVLLPHPSLESFATLDDNMLADAVYKKAAAAFLNLPMADPGYARIESSLLKCFKDFPKVVAPLAGKPRTFQMRMYESHNEVKCKNKVHMFNEGGEIEIFKKSGLSPVFFGETLIGSLRPNLTYMICFTDTVELDKNWDVFRKHPDWLALKEKPEYAETVSRITDILLTPTSFSQI